MSESRQVISSLLKGLFAAALLLAFFTVLGKDLSDAAAASSATTRVYLRTGTRVYHHWLITKIGRADIECHIYTVTDDQPGHEDVLGFCGSQVYDLWVEGPVCLQGQAGSQNCAGVVLQDIGEIDQRLKTTIWLPVAEVNFQIHNCAPWEDCSNQPVLRVTGFEPLQNQRIESIHIEYTNITGQVCRRADECIVNLPQTGDQGTNVNLYVRSSYGDQSAVKTFRLRLIPQDNGSVLFQVLQGGWDYLAPPESVAWGIFPDLDISDAPWLLKTRYEEDIATYHDYSLLAGRYILRGDVDVSRCIFGGLTESGGATQCGMELARPVVYAAQNQYDPLIIEAGLRSRIPPRIIKGVIAQESQFWPEWYFEGEYGLGMLTDDGIEMMMTWNPVAFLEFCTPIYGENDCAWGYDSFDDYPQDVLRGRALSQVGSSNEVNVIAQTIVGAAAQSGQIIRNVTRQEPYLLLSYRDMWRITLGVYNSGAGCLYYAIDEAWDQHGRLTWGGISEYLIGECQNAAEYPDLVVLNGVP